MIQSEKVAVLSRDAISDNGASSAGFIRMLILVLMKIKGTLKASTNIDRV